MLLDPSETDGAVGAALALGSGVLLPLAVVLLPALLGASRTARALRWRLPPGPTPGQRRLPTHDCSDRQGATCSNATLGNSQANLPPTPPSTRIRTPLDEKARRRLADKASRRLVEDTDIAINVAWICGGGDVATWPADYLRRMLPCPLTPPSCWPSSLQARPWHSRPLKSPRAARQGATGDAPGGRWQQPDNARAKCWHGDVRKCY